MKITFSGAGSTIFSRNVLGDRTCASALSGMEKSRSTTSTARGSRRAAIIEAIRKGLNADATIKSYPGVENRKERCAARTSW